MTAAIVRLAKLVLIAAALAAPLASRAAAPVYTSWRGLTIAGANPVACFTEGGPVEGRREHSRDWNGATWRFVGAEHLANWPGVLER